MTPHRNQAPHRQSRMNQPVYTGCRKLHAFACNRVVSATVTASVSLSHCVNKELSLARSVARARARNLLHCQVHVPAGPASRDRCLSMSHATPHGQVGRRTTFYTTDMYNGARQRHALPCKRSVLLRATLNFGLSTPQRLSTHQPTLTDPQKPSQQ